MSMAHVSALFGLGCLFSLLVCAPAHADSIVVRTAQYTLQLNGENGDIESLQANGRELVYKSGKARALFGLRFREVDGKPVDVTALGAKSFSIAREEGPDEARLVLSYSELDGRPVNVTVTVRCPLREPMTYWSLALENHTGLRLDHVDFPTVVTPNDLVGKGGDARLFWPAMEGVVVEDLALRESFWWKWQPIEHPAMGWLGLYPSACPMQFMAYYGNQAGLYIAAQDKESYPKGIEFHAHPDGGIFLDYRLFPGGILEPSYAMPYEMAIGVFQGDWYNAADRYRGWLEHSGMPRPPKLAENPARPDWVDDSPIVVTYPVRGTKDLGDMTPNEYFPYTHALPDLRDLAAQFDSKVLALLMHWEGSAPWAPPYVWPPYGGTDDFAEFVKTLYDEGNRVGLYASGTGYTIRSNTDPTYDKTTEFNEKHLLDIVTQAPDGKPAENGVCAGPHAQRIGYDMCPANDWVKDVVTREVAKILPSGVDYLQYFDQNLGGSCYRCYAHTHGHPPAPGLWQNDAMMDIYRRLQELVARGGRKVLIGCEAAAGEPFIPYLLCNDSRNYLNLHAGAPVPAYAYVNHEYLNNFMGNQNAVSAFVDLARSPLNLHQRVAMSFVQGDFLTAVLKGGGKLCWEWGGSWDAVGPDHDSVATLMRNLNGWRRGAGKPYLIYGRMLKPYAIQGDTEIPMFTPRNQKITFRSIFTSRWTTGKTTAQIVVNYTPEPQSIAVSTSPKPAGAPRVYTDPFGVPKVLAPDGDGRIPLTVPALSAVLLEWDGQGA
jgi:hypothetical protein